MKVIQTIGWISIGISGLFMLANYTILAQGHIVGTVERDSEGNVVLDAQGEPVFTVNPHYVQYEKEQRNRDIIACSILITGVVLVLGVRLLNKNEKDS